MDAKELPDSASDLVPLVSAKARVAVRQAFVDAGANPQIADGVVGRLIHIAADVVFDIEFFANEPELLRGLATLARRAKRQAADLASTLATMRDLDPVLAEGSLLGEKIDFPSSIHELGRLRAACDGMIREYANKGGRPKNTLPHRLFSEACAAWRDATGELPKISNSSGKDPPLFTSLLAIALAMRSTAIIKAELSRDAFLRARKACAATAKVAKPTSA